VDKRIVLAVAGAGKTTTLISRLDLSKRALIITYADNNVDTLRRKIVDAFGYLPPNISIYSYFTFLHSFCYKPFLLLQMGRTQGLNFKPPPPHTLRLRRTSNDYYLDSNNRLYYGRLSKLLAVKNVVHDVVRRIEKYYDEMLIDEIQDFGGNDFDFLKSIITVNLNVLLVGDFFQSTYTTSRDGQVHMKLHQDFETYLDHYRKCGLGIDQASLVRSYRCSPTVCEFVREKMGIEIHSHLTAPTVVKFIENLDEAVQLYHCSKTVKLFYAEHSRYDCYSQNWGASKGQDHYQDVCVVLNGTSLTAFKKSNLRELASLTKNKLYVACTRTRGNLYFVSDQMFKKFKSTST
jgi:DNA helicase II / ATP-dependent DNA helicase PcrA